MTENAGDWLQQATTLLQGGRVAEAVPVLGEAVAAARSEGAIEAEATALGMLAEAHQHFGQWSPARQAARAAHELAVTAGQRAAADHFAGQVALMDYLAKLYPEGGEAILDPLSVIEASVTAWRATRVPAEEAIHLRAAVAAAVAGRRPGEEAGLLAALAPILLRLGQLAEARAALERAIFIAQVLEQDEAKAHFEALLSQMS